MTWTTSKPKNESWRWFRRHKLAKPTIAHIELDDGLWTVQMGWNIYRLDEINGGQWSSEPIKEPVEAEVETDVKHLAAEIVKKCEERRNGERN